MSIFIKTKKAAFEFGSLSEQLKKYMTLGINNRGITGKPFDVVGGGPLATALRMVGLIGSYVAEKLFENRKLKEGTPVAVRLNLNTTIFFDEDTGKINELKNKFANIKNEEGFKLAGKEFGKYRNKRKKEIAIETGVSILTLQTAHDKKTDGTALGYDKAITVADPTFDVNQKDRFKVIEKREKIQIF